jgi:hypothetical protein
MRKLTLLTFFLTLTAAFSLQADTKHQSFISFDDGGTVVRQGDDAREIEGRVNLPIYPGDEIVTNRRGRVEIRLSDGNVIAIDRGTALRFQSMLDNYEGESSDTIAELRYGKVMIYRTDEGREAIRLDTASASYFASREAIFSVEADAGGEDRVNVFDGAVEVRTPTRTTRLRSGEIAKVDDRGLYSLASDGGYGSDDFERWFLRRAERYGRAQSRYLDRSLAYYDDELSRHGSWVYISGYGYAWRPYGISVGWRPYFYGHWTRGRAGCLTWVSYEPWGWVPYHYGRWAYDPFYGWFWVPGAGYSPAWVYWWYSPGYIGWAPAGWWDCYRPYYDWAYRPYARAGFNFGFGFYGRIRVSDVDLRPWTFVDANTIVSTRADRAAITTDAVRDRLTRQNGGFATIGTTPARFTREELRDPAAAVGVIARRAGGGTGREAASPTDLTPFIRRDADLGGSIRDRVIRTRPTEGAPPPGTSAGSGSGSIAPIGRGSVAPIGSGSVAPTHRGDPDSGGRINRGEQPRTEQPRSEQPRSEQPRSEQPRSEQPRIEREQPRSEQPPSGSQSPSWRDRVSRAPRDETPVTKAPVDEAPISRTPERRDESWRSRVVREAAPAGGEKPSASEGDRGRSSDVPRRIIDRVVGPRVYPSRERSAPKGDPPSTGGSNSTPRSRPAAVDRPSSSPPPRTERSSPPPSSDRGSSRSSGEGGGRIKRDQ